MKLSTAFILSSVALIGVGAKGIGDSIRSFNEPSERCKSAETASAEVTTICGDVKIRALRQLALGAGVTLGRGILLVPGFAFKRIEQKRKRFRPIK